MLKFLIIFLSGAGLSACSSVTTLSVQSAPIPVTANYEKENSVDSMVAPYKVALEAEMNEVIASAPNDFTRGRPNGSLNNWAADVVLNAMKDSLGQEKSVMSLLNFGGLRNSLNQGDIALKDIFQLMPFDNEIVIIEMPLETIPEIEAYLKASGGEPIGGARIVEGKLILDELKTGQTSFFIVTSDYLFNGGDKMYFFQKNLAIVYTGILIRDAMIAAAKEQGELVWNEDERIGF